MNYKVSNRILSLIGICTMVFIAYSCSEEVITPDVVSTDISVTSNSTSITWIDQNDLNAQLEAAITFNTGKALDNEVNKSIQIEADSSSATASIAFKVAFQDDYSDVIPTNNSVTITLIKNAGSVGGTTLSADGPGDTYALISSVLAPGSNPIEAPDCSHPGFGDHIDELWDDELNKNVFRFHLHTDSDDDRCINFDRQRNEIKSFDKSPDNLLGVENETVVYTWKFKLTTGFQSSPNFTHIHQLKSVGGSLESMPMYTLTTRKGSPDRIELRYAETDNQVTLSQTELQPLIGSWIEVIETIKYGTSGTYDILIRRVSDESVLFTYSTDAIINWRPGASFVRPKWGIYRSLENAQDLRDETVLYADFHVEEI